MGNEETKEVKPLSKDDFENGMAIEAELAAIRERANAATNAYEIYVAILRQRYDAPIGEYELRDWAKGFEPVSEGD